MDENLALTDASVPMMIDGKEYLAKCPKDRDFVELEEWIRAQYIQLANIASKGLEDSEREGIRSNALKTAMKIKWNDDNGMSVVNSIDGMARICWLMLRQQNKNISYEQLQKNVMDADNADEVVRVFNHFNAQVEKNNQKSEDSEKN